MTNPKNKPATPIGQKVHFKGKSYQLVEDLVLSPNGNHYSHITLLHPGAVAILAINSKNQVVLVSQYRHSIKSEFLEIPAGKLESNEDPKSSALRELAEEVGFGATQLISLGKIYPAPGFCSEILHLFLAKDLYPHTLPADEDESIKVVLMPLDELQAKIEDNQINDAKTIAAFYLAKAKQLLSL